LEELRTAEEKDQDSMYSQRGGEERKTIREFKSIVRRERDKKKIRELKRKKRFLTIKKKIKKKKMGTSTSPIPNNRLMRVI